MIHYHGAPVGGPYDAAARFWMGRHAFVSFANPEQLQIVADACQSFALDNGAFTAWKGGKALDVNGYREWVLEWYRHPGYDWHCIPDVIDGEERDNAAIINEWPFAKHHSVPVWHMHESTVWLEHLARTFPRVALGSSGAFSVVGSAEWWRRMSEALNAVTDDNGRPRCKLHGLRMLDPEVFRHLPLSSADSTNAGRNAGNSGRWPVYAPKHAWQRAGVIADRIEAQTSAANWTGEVQQCFGF